MAATVNNIDAFLASQKHAFVLDFHMNKLWEQFCDNFPLSKDDLDAVKGIIMNSKKESFNTEIRNKLLCTQLFCGLSESIRKNKDGKITYHIPLAPQYLNITRRICMIYPFSVVEQAHMLQNMRVQILLSVYMSKGVAEAKKFLEAQFPEEADKEAGDYYDDLTELFQTENESVTSHIVKKYSYRKFRKSLAEDFLKPIWDQYDVSILEQHLNSLKRTKRDSIPLLLLKIFHDHLDPNREDVPEELWTSIADQTQPDVIKLQTRIETLKGKEKGLIKAARTEAKVLSPRPRKKEWRKRISKTRSDSNSISDSDDTSDVATRAKRACDRLREANQQLQKVVKDAYTKKSTMMESSDSVESNKNKERNHKGGESLQNQKQQSRSQSNEGVDRNENKERSHEVGESRRSWKQQSRSNEGVDRNENERNHVASESRRCQKQQIRSNKSVDTNENKERSHEAGESSRIWKQQGQSRSTEGADRNDNTNHECKEQRRCQKQRGLSNNVADINEKKEMKQGHSEDGQSRKQHDRSKTNKETNHKGCKSRQDRSREDKVNINERNCGVGESSISKYFAKSSPSKIMKDPYTVISTTENSSGSEENDENVVINLEVGKSVQSRKQQSRSSEVVVNENKERDHDDSRPCTSSTHRNVQVKRALNVVKRRWQDEQNNAEMLEWSDEDDDLDPPLKLNPIKRNKPPHKKKPWTQEELNWLIDGVKVFGKGNWSKILRRYPFPTYRTSVHLKDKWRIYDGDRKYSAY